MSITLLVLTTDGLTSKEVAYVLLFINRITILIAGIDKVVRYVGFGHKVYFSD